TSTALAAWKVAFTLPSGSTVTSLWNGTEAAAGQNYTVTPASWNGTVPVGGSVNFGFEVNGTGAPTSCTINGAACTGGSSAPTSRPATPSTPSTPAAPSPSKPVTTPTPTSTPT